MPGMRDLRQCVEDVITPRRTRALRRRQATLARRGFPESISAALAALPTPGSALDIIHVAADHNLPISAAAEVYFALGEALHLSG